MFILRIGEGNDDEERAPKELPLPKAWVRWKRSPFPQFRLFRLHWNCNPFLCENIKSALTGVAQLVVCLPTKRKVTGSIPSQGTGLSCGGFSPQLGCMQEATDQCYFSHQCFSLSLSSSLLVSLKLNK